MRIWIDLTPHCDARPAAVRNPSKGVTAGWEGDLTRQLRLKKRIVNCDCTTPAPNDTYASSPQFTTSSTPVVRLPPLR